MSTPKRDRPADSDFEEDDYSAQRRRHSSEESPEVFGRNVEQMYSQMCSQNDNPTPANLRGRDRGEKTVQDRVHGQVTLDALLVEVMDTPEFQRLDNIKQLGGCSYIYPSATHTRKEHSIGVAYLAGYMVNHLRELQPELNIDAADLLCVKLAGLVHDIGHGPFSHMFEEFVHEVGRQTNDKRKEDYTHEAMSESLLRHLVHANGIDLDEYFDDGRGEEHLNFVVQCIKGLDDHKPWPANLGRGEEKRFLLDIVSNARNGIDVDKLDYLVRDAMCAFGSSNPPVFDILRIIKSSRVLRRQDANRPSGRRPGEVCFQMKVMHATNEVYKLRTVMHQFVYQHRIANVAEGMITDLLLGAQSFRFRYGRPGEETRLCSLADAVHEPAAFVALTDSVLDMIATSQTEGLDEARTLRHRLQRRDFYRQVGESIKLRMLPTCLSCGEPTELSVKFCPSCGAKTKRRNAEREVKKGDTTPLEERPWVAPDFDLSEETAREEIWAILDNDGEPKFTHEQKLKVFVHIVTIHHGKKTTTVDPWGEKWRTYDPLACIGFFNPKEEPEAGGDYEIKHVPPGREKMPGIFMPKEKHLRTLYCYYKGPPMASKHARWGEEDEELYERVAKALDKWKRDRKVQTQLGTANGTPSRHSTPRQLGQRSREGSQQAASSSQAPMEPLAARLTPVEEQEETETLEYR